MGERFNIVSRATSRVAVGVGEGLTFMIAVLSGMDMRKQWYNGSAFNPLLIAQKTRMENKFLLSLMK